jgi:hypothetical protein
MTMALGVALAVATVAAVAGWVRSVQLSSALTAERVAREAEGRRLAVVEKDLRSRLDAELSAKRAEVEAEISKRKHDFFIDAGNGAVIKWLKVHHPMTVDEAILQVRDPEIRAALGDYWGVREGGYPSGDVAPSKMKVPLPR